MSTQEPCMQYLPDRDYHNREEVASTFNCRADGHDHDAECFVIFMSGTGQAAIPLCAAAVQDAIEDLSKSIGIREVYPKPSTTFRGQIEGVRSNR